MAEQPESPQEVTFAKPPILSEIMKKFGVVDSPVDAQLFGTDFWTVDGWREKLLLHPFLLCLLTVSAKSVVSTWFSIAHVSYLVKKPSEAMHYMATLNFTMPTGQLVKQPQYDTGMIKLGRYPFLVRAILELQQGQRKSYWEHELPTLIKALTSRRSKFMPGVRHSSNAGLLS